MAFMPRRNIMGDVVAIGVDPGITGAIAFVGPAGLIAAFRTPVITPEAGKGRKTMDLSECATIIREQLETMNSRSRLVLCIEKVHAMPRDGCAGAFSFGASYGAWKGIAAAIPIPLTEVTPQAWQKEMLAGQSGSDTKSRAVAAAKSLFPGIPIKCKLDWGIADAALIAEYARRRR